MCLPTECCPTRKCTPRRLAKLEGTRAPHLAASPAKLEAPLSSRLPPPPLPKSLYIPFSVLRFCLCLLPPRCDSAGASGPDATAAEARRAASRMTTSFLGPRKEACMGGSQIPCFQLSSVLCVPQNSPCLLGRTHCVKTGLERSVTHTDAKHICETGEP